MGWVLAAAAALIAVLGWWPRLGGPTTTDPIAQRAALLETAQDAFQKGWTVTEDPAAVSASGDVVWSDSRNEGYMRIVGLRANDPKEYQYQLWVFDRSRDERYPVDGGVFNVSAGEEAVIPIDPKIPVDEAVLFAITVEEPGGVVVSERERIVLLAEKS